jgi:hypothetical protein
MFGGEEDPPQAHPRTLLAVDRDPVVYTGMSHPDTMILAS